IRPHYEQNPDLGLEDALWLVRRKAIVQPRDVAPAGPDRGDGILTGDFRSLGAQVADGSVRLLMTDPPYDRGSVPLYEDLALLAKRVLAPGGIAVAYCGNLLLDKVLPVMGRHLEYVTTFCAIHTGRNGTLWSVRVENWWKPV